MKIRFRNIVFVIFILISIDVMGQENKNWNNYIGINLLQIPATTIDITYEMAQNPRYSIILNSGYTINYSNSFDMIGSFLSPHYKCGNNGFSMKQQTGGFIKIGIKYNFRKSFEKQNYFFIGAFLTNSLVYEKAEYENLDIPNSQIEYLNHKVFIIGLTGAFGYNFRIADKITSDFGIHISIPSNQKNDLYGYSNYISGMGYMETCGNKIIFPMIVLNLKYQIRL